MTTAILLLAEVYPYNHDLEWFYIIGFWFVFIVKLLENIVDHLNDRE